MKFIVLTYVLLLLITISAIPQSAIALWELSSTTTTSVSVTGDITGQNESFGGMTINNYAGPNNSQRVTTLDGNWPAESQQNNNRYIQFALSPEVGFNLTVNNITMNLGAAGGGNMRANIWYSKEVSFENAVQLNSSVLVLPNGGFIVPSPDYTLNEIVNDGETFYLRIYPWYNTSSSGKYVCPQNVTISGTSISSSAIFPSVNFLDLGTAVAGSSSESVSYSVFGTNLSESVTVKAPSGFKISSDNINFSDSITLPLSGNILPGTTLYVRFDPTLPSGTTTGLLTHVSAEVTANFELNGIALTSEPTTSSIISFGTVTGNSITVNFSGGNGSNRIVVIKSGSAVNWEPVDGNIISGVSNNFLSAVDQGNGNKVVYNGAGSQVTVSGLTGSTVYHFSVYEYNIGTNNSHNYFTSLPGTANQATSPAPTILVSPSTLPFGNVVTNTTSVEKTYVLSANTLTPLNGVIAINAPNGFEVSTSSGSGFSSSIEIPYTGGALNNTTIFVRFNPTSVTFYSGNIINSGANAQAKGVSVTGNGITPGDPNVFQAEDAFLFGSYVRTQYSGYTASGYVDLADRMGSFLEFVFRRDQAATNIITVYYANGGSSRSLSVSLNDVVISSLSFPSTGSWTNWSSVSISLPLAAGINRIKLRSTTNGSNPNIDRIFVAGSEAFPMYKLTLKKSGSGTVSANPFETYYDAGTQVTLSAFPSQGNTFFRWGGTENNFSNPGLVIMNSHKTVIGIMMDTTGISSFPVETSPRGFASMNSLGYANGTTGGSGPEAGVAFVSTSTEFADIMYGRVDANRTLNLPPLTVYVIGTLLRDSGLSNMIDIKDAYDISVIGVGGDAAFSGVGLKISRSSNIIVRNILFINAPDDGISIQADDDESTGHHIWIDHCSFTNSYDGALDVTHTAAYVTLSWNHFYNVDKTSLMGHSDSQISDTAMKVTYHHNFFNNTRQRHPRVRFGKAHVYNNYYLGNPTTIYGVSSNMNAQVMVEGNYFVNNPIPTETSRDGSPPGNVVERNNIFVNCGVPGVGGTVFEPSVFYSYSLDPTMNIPSLLTSYAGSGKYDFSLADSATVPSGPSELVSLEAQAVNTSQINILFTTNASNDVVVIVWNNTGLFTIPEGIPPLPGESFAGGVMLYNGISSPFSHTDLMPSTQYFYKAFSYNGIYYSSGLIDSAITLGSTAIQLSVDIANGWNMVAIPGLHPVDQNVNTWWAGKDPAAGVFRFAGGYQAVTTVAPGTGYWMKYVGANTYNTGDEWPAGGIQIVPNDPIPAVTGWNLIGGYHLTVATAGITTTPVGLISGQVFGYTPGSGYAAVTNLVPGYGYWIKLTGAGNINLPSSLAKSAPVSEYIKSDWGRIMLTDAAGKSYILYSVDGEVDLTQYELPPLPPAGMFDVRYGSQRLAEVIGSEIQTIEMQGIEYPVTVRVEGMTIRLQDETGKIVNQVIKSGEDVVISNPQVGKLKVSGNVIPETYSLEQNYPNPFNPSTTIEFSIPEDVENLKLTIYDALGQKVAELVNGKLEAGRYSYQWDASKLASGLYIYQLQTNKFTSTKKMLMLK